MSDVGPYGTLQNPDADAVTANQLVGERAGSVTAHQSDSRFGPATSSTAPYVPPPICRFKNCRQPRQQGFFYCDRHVGGDDT